MKVCQTTADVVYGVWADGRLALTNEAWDRFALDNGAPDLPASWPLGRSIWDAVPNVLGPFYRLAFGEVVRSGAPWRHDYQCPGPDRFRLLHMEVWPAGTGVLVFNSIRVEHFHDETLHADTGYQDTDGRVYQCAHCRRVRVPSHRDRWHFVPALVERPDSSTAHALCPTCLAWHYPPNG